MARLSKLTNIGRKRYRKYLPSVLVEKGKVCFAGLTTVGADGVRIEIHAHGAPDWFFLTMTHGEFNALIEDYQRACNMTTKG
jgi:hypothetical protein